MHKMIRNLAVGVTLGALTLSAWNGRASGRAATSVPSIADARVILSIASPFSNRAFFSEACGLVRDIVNDWNMSTQQLPRCIELLGEDSAELKKARDESAADLHISVSALSDGSHQLVIENWNQQDSADIRKLTWKIEPQGDWKKEVSRLLAHYSEFDEHKTGFKKFLLVNAIEESRKVGIDQSGQYYDKSSGRNLSFDEAYANFRDESAKQKNYLQAALEIGAVIGFSTVHYYAFPQANNRDWDYTPKQAWSHRLSSGDAVRFDDNYFHTNKGHYYAGAIYYTAARSNGLDRMESFLYTFAASTAWEYVSELREVVSINDQINTTFGGFIIGETLHNIGKIFQGGSNTIGNRTLRAIFGSPERFQGWVSKNVSGRKVDLSDTGFTPDVWSKVDIYGGIAKQRGAQERMLGFNAQIIDIPMFEEPGYVQKIITDDVFSELLLEQGLGSQDLSTFKFFVKTTLGAYYEKNLSLDSRGRLNGYNLYVGPSSALEIEEQRGRSVTKDFHGIVHVLGASLDMTAYIHGVRVRFMLDVYGDFAMMRSYAIDAYAASNDVSHISSVLKNQDYYYGAGTTGSLKIVGNAGPFEMGASVNRIGSEIITSKSRFSNGSVGASGPCGEWCNQVDSVKIHANDTRIDTKAWVAYQITPALKAQLAMERIDRSGTIKEGGSASASEIRRTGTLIYTFK